MSVLAVEADEARYSGGPQRLYAFRRHEWRRSKFRRHLDCGHKIDHGEEYSYFVGKVMGLAELVQIRLCRFCTYEGR